MSKGWIKLHRQIMDNVIYSDKPFCRPMAFIDLIMRASHNDTDLYFNGSIITVERGSFITSYDKISEAWGWSTTKVRRYFKHLIKLGMIEVESDEKKTVVSLINFDIYQGVETTENIQKTYSENTEVIQKNTIKNVKNYKNEKEDIYIGSSDFDKVMSACFHHLIGDAITSQIAIKKYLDLLTYDEMISCIQRSESKHVKYLLKVFETKAEDKKKPKPEKPVLVSKTNNKKPQMVMSGPEQSKPLTEEELNEIRKLFGGS